jgi:hypothetical protein
MPIVVACPSCQNKLRVADELREQMVRCPSCSVTFFPGTGDTTPPPPPPPGAVWNDLPLESVPASSSSPQPEPIDPEVLDEGDSSRFSRPPRLTDEDDDLRPCPRCGRLLHRDATRCSSCGRRSPSPSSSLVRTAPRRDSEPDRGSMVLTLGILSLVMLSFCIPLGVVFGLCAWVMGSQDLRKIRAGSMDESGQGMTHAGWICGILGTLINGLLTLSCVGFIIVILTINNSKTSSPPRPTAPTTFQNKGFAPRPVPPPQPVPPRRLR